MSNTAPDILDEPDSIDPRPCMLCGCGISEHEMVDDGEGPIFLCPELDDTAADIVRRWELSDSRDSWKHTGEQRPRMAATPRPAVQPYRPAQSTVDAFLFVVCTKDAAGITEWLADHPRDERYLQKIWEQKCSTAAAK
jgi:hypothetical protein